MRCRPKQCSHLSCNLRCNGASEMGQVDCSRCPELMLITFGAGRRICFLHIGIGIRDRLRIYRFAYIVLGDNNPVMMYMRSMPTQGCWVDVTTCESSFFLLVV